MYVCCLFARWASRHQHVKRARARETREAQWEAGALGEVVLPGGLGVVVAAVAALFGAFGAAVPLVRAVAAVAHTVVYTIRWDRHRGVTTSVGIERGTVFDVRRSEKTAADQIVRGQPRCLGFGISQQGQEKVSAV